MNRGLPIFLQDLSHRQTHLVDPTCNWT